MNDVLFSSKKTEWETPQDFFDALDAEFRFTLDPCASVTNHKCDKYFTKNENGLLQDWSGETVFCNPPYGKDIRHWVEKCYLESVKNKITVVMLIHARTDTRWFHDFVYHKAEIRFVKGRLKFGGTKNSAPFPSMVVIYRGNN